MFELAIFLWWTRETCHVRWKCSGLFLPGGGEDPGPGKSQSHSGSSRNIHLLLFRERRAKTLGSQGLASESKGFNTGTWGVPGSQIAWGGAYVASQAQEHEGQDDAIATGMCVLHDALLKDKPRQLPMRCTLYRGAKAGRFESLRRQRDAVSTLTKQQRARHDMQAVGSYRALL